ncbi:unnamed protein product [Vitrella brassicaformis CCMP3155]|uniref:Surfeit locus protein 2 n=2 Tax=Vitrella brassicaformis TaxID=1169539 RepID=A0A0G4GML5_VITBC|nr:unnamed protein product [Vitrella brassicaformis CCMP3155]|mmetsp:Transcript_38956/g.97464  ORF Transcript_38956/g.97464 Transcript_38956/m.97464 type:complete len:269 (+) Transcript_38956:82-888(+)|eukprot:CEM31370.1 unnamed protein product [Vitrella brassicaformis CCMP3155]
MSAKDDDLLEFVRQHEDLTYLEDRGKIKCIITDHEMPLRRDVVDAHLKAKKYLAAKKGWHQHDYTQYEPYIVPHKTNKSKLYCTLTGHSLNRNPDEVQREVNGRRYRNALKAFQEQEEKQRRKDRRRQERREAAERRRAEGKGDDVDLDMMDEGSDSNDSDADSQEDEDHEMADGGDEAMEAASDEGAAADEDGEPQEGSAAAAQPAAHRRRPTRHLLVENDADVQSAKRTVPVVTMTKRKAGTTKQLQKLLEMRSQGAAAGSQTAMM